MNPLLSTNAVPGWQCRPQGQGELHAPGLSEVPGRLVSEPRRLGVQPAHGASAAAAGPGAGGPAAPADRPGPTTLPACSQVGGPPNGAATPAYLQGSSSTAEVFNPGPQGPPVLHVLDVFLLQHT